MVRAVALITFVPAGAEGDRTDDTSWSIVAVYPPYDSVRSKLGFCHTFANVNPDAVGLLVSAKPEPEPTSQKRGVSVLRNSAYDACTTL